MSQRFMTHIAAETNANGTVQVVGVDSRTAIWQNAQSSPGSTTYGTGPGSWTNINGALRP